MKFSIIDKVTQDKFIGIFQLLKNITSIISFIFKDDYIHIQGMDSGHICLFDINLNKEWFETYIIGPNELTTVYINSQILHNVLSMVHESHSIIFHFEDNPDNISIDLFNESKGDLFNKFFKIPLSELDTEILEITEYDYDVDFSIGSKKIQDVLSQLLLFGEVLNISCSEEKINLNSTSVNGDMLVNIPIEEITEFSISEGEIIDISFNLKFILKMCTSNKLSTDIEFSIRKNYPMRIKYDLGKNNYLKFYIAPQITEE